MNNQAFFVLDFQMFMSVFALWEVGQVLGYFNAFK
jgi:hypothetical protein